MTEANGISLDSAKPAENSSGAKQAKPGVATRKDFYAMTDEEIEQHLGKSENGVGSFEALQRGFRRP
jgi:hypothetical protein